MPFLNLLSVLVKTSGGVTGLSREGVKVEGASGAMSEVEGRADEKSEMLSGHLRRWDLKIFPHSCIECVNSLKLFRTAKQKAEKALRFSCFQLIVPLLTGTDRKNHVG